MENSESKTTEQKQLNKNKETYYHLSKILAFHGEDF